ncbi:MAG TPA: ribosome biogenesis GTPase Der [Armatimonadota bacterium]|jgi:GTP-binding protein
MAKPTVAVVGRPNVGKSTLFNRIIGERVAIVEDTPGVTRDRIYANVEWNGRPFAIVDTGGIVPGGELYIQDEIYQQARTAVAEADVVIFVVDALEGPTPIDYEVADVMRRSSEHVILAVNKVDSARREDESVEFYGLGLGDVHPISALNGRDVADLLDEVVKRFPADDELAEEEEDSIRVALVGRPNVGKSSLLNAMLGENRAIVSAVPGTTRDAVDTAITVGEDKYVLVDTAGIRRAGKVQGTVEYYMVLRAQRAIERADVTALIIDANEGVTDGDARVGGLSNDAGRACVIVVNKWDLVHATQMHKFAQDVKEKLPFLEYAPVIFTSALTGRGVKDLLPTIKTVADNHAMRVSTAEINRVIGEAVDARPYGRRGKDLKVRYATQVSVKPPTVAVMVNNPTLSHSSYDRYLVNKLRESFGFVGTPIRLFMRRSTDREERE